MTVLQPVSSRVVVTVRPCASVWEETARDEDPCGPDEDETLEDEDALLLSCEDEEAWALAPFGPRVALVVISSPLERT